MAFSVDTAAVSGRQRANVPMHVCTEACEYCGFIVQVQYHCISASVYKLNITEGNTIVVRRKVRNIE